MKQHTRSHTSFDEAFAYEVLSVVEEIPEGKVATYGQIARLIGKEKNSRLVARALSHAEQFGEFPCHRVVNHTGRLAPGWVEQGFLLMQEGVELKDRNHVDLKKYRGIADEKMGAAKNATPISIFIICCSSVRLLPVLLPVLRSEHGMENRKRSPDRSCCRTLRKMDLRHARHRYQCADLDWWIYQV